MRVAYLINQYPMVSQTFIRREIQALELQGFEILRIALRAWTGEVVDEQDKREKALTRYVLDEGPVSLILGMLRALSTSPRRTFAALALAIRMSRHADRPLRYHLAYFAEACRIVPWLKAFGAEHVHAHFGTNSTEVAMLARALGGPPYSFTAHGPEEFDKAQFLGIGEKIRRSAFAVAISSYGRGQLFRWVEHAHWPKVRVVHCGLEPSFHDVAPSLPQASPRLVCVGRLCEQKGQSLLVAAVARLARKGIRVELVLAGDGDMRSALEALISASALEGQVKITGWLRSEQVRDEIFGARALVLPSFAEGLPVVVMEAMALRRPVLTTFVAGIPELVVPGVGWLFPSGDVDALAAAIEDCLSRPADELRRMGEAARARVLERHSIDVEATKLAALFRHSAATETGKRSHAVVASSHPSPFADRIGMPPS